MPLSRKIKQFFIIVLIISVGLIIAIFFSNLAHKKLTVAFLDIGQGDAIFIEAPSGKQILIDGGPDKSVLRQLNKVMAFYDRSIDVVIATHPDQDHIGGLPEVIKRFNVDTIIVSGNTSETSASDAFEYYSQKEGSKILQARRGMSVLLGNGVVLDILFPDRDVSNIESNDASIVAKLSYGETSFIFTGDSPKKIENYLVGLYGEALDVDVLKVGHHGSNTSTSEPFLSYTSPEYAVVSAGKDNKYGHPHSEVIDLLNERKIKVFNTADVGTAIFKSDGKSLWTK